MRGPVQVRDEPTFSVCNGDISSSKTRKYIFPISRIRRNVVVRTINNQHQPINAPVNLIREFLLLLNITPRASSGHRGGANPQSTDLGGPKVVSDWVERRGTHREKLLVARWPLGGARRALSEWQYLHVDWFESQSVTLTSTVGNVEKVSITG